MLLFLQIPKKRCWVKMCENIKEKAKEILNKMSLADKLGQVTQLTFNDSDIESSCEMVKRIKPGSLILCWSAMGGNEAQQSVCIEHLNRLQRTAVEETPCGVPLLYGRDVIHGHRVAFPVPLTMTQSFDFGLIEECYDAIRQEASDEGVNWSFAPMLDLARDPRWGRIVEGAGEDPYLGALFAKASVKGFQTDNPASPDSVVACAKHFVGYGAAEGGRDYNHAEISDYSLQNYYLPAFRAAVESGVGTVMSSFNDVNGIPVSGSRRMLTEILRGQLGFEGFVISDWDAIVQLYSFCAYAEDRADAAAKALNAGIDMDMVCNCFIDNLEKLIEDGEVTMDELDTAVLRILETKLRFGIFDNPYAEIRGYDLEKHLSLAKKLAEESIVLLKNKNGILPLAKNAKLGYAGNFRDEAVELVGTWSLDFDASLTKTIRNAISDTAPECELFDCDDTDAYRISAYNDTDYTLVVFGEKRKLTGEANNVAEITFSPTQKALVESLRRAGRPIIGVFCFARPIVFGDEDNLFDAILYCGHGGTRAADAISSVLFGEAEPQGRLPFTLPYNMGQMPIYYNALPGSREINGYYGNVYFPHADYHNCTGKPNYPFGFGLAYTDFEIGEIECAKSELSLCELEAGESFRLSVKIKNTGERKGLAIPQLYIRDLCGSRMRPLRVLRAFERIWLEAGEEKTVEFSIGVKDLGFYLENSEFITEKGKFNVFIGESCLAEQNIEIAVI